jgi:glucose-1-phosphate cytidylyltransferase
LHLPPSIPDETLLGPLSGIEEARHTVKERHALEAAYLAGTRPWMLWELPERDPLQALIQAELER